MRYRIKKYDPWDVVLRNSLELGQTALGMLKQQSDEEGA